MSKLQLKVQRFLVMIDKEIFQDSQEEEAGSAMRLPIFSLRIEDHFDFFYNIFNLSRTYDCQKFE